MSGTDACREPPDATRPEALSILVLGVGNLLQKDDGVGIHAVRAFGRVSPAGVLAADIGTNAWSALPLLEAADKVIVLDAMKAGGVPGSVYVSAIGDIRREAVRGSLHELDVVNVVATMHGRRPEIVVVAAEPQTVELGMELEPVVEAAVPRMVEAAMRLVQLWSSMHSASPSPHTDLSTIFPYGQAGQAASSTVRNLDPTAVGRRAYPSSASDNEIMSPETAASHFETPHTPSARREMQLSVTPRPHCSAAPGDF